MLLYNLVYANSIKMLSVLLVINNTFYQLIWHVYITQH